MVLAFPTRFLEHVLRPIFSSPTTQAVDAHGLVLLRCLRVEKRIGAGLSVV
jgi:hypothetical protein